MKTLSQNEMVQLYREYQNTKHNGVKCGVQSLDRIIRMDKKSLAVLTARPNEGKSTFINYYCYMMAVNNNWKTLYFNFETDNGRFLNELVKLYGCIEEVIKYCIIADINDITSLDELYGVIEEQKEINNIDMCVIDPFMRLNGWLSDINTYSIGQVLTELQQRAIKNNMLILIAAHPSKIKDGEPVRPNDIMGSTYFYTVSDFIFTLSVEDRERMITQIETLKIRNNFDMGICGASCHLRYDPFTRRYEEVSDYDKNDIPFSKKVSKDIMKEMCENDFKAHREDITNTDEELPKEEDLKRHKPNKSQTEPLDPKDIIVGVFRNVNMKIPYRKLSLYDATKLGNEQKEIIDEIRIICETKPKEWENKKRELKMKLNCYLPQFDSRHRRLDDDAVYNNLLQFDIDDKDNNLSVEDIREILINDIHTYYLGLSASGKGLYGFFRGNGNIKDYERQYKAMSDYFNKLGIIIDNNAKDITRIRCVSYDDNDFWNYNAVPFSEIEETTNTHHKNNISMSILSTPNEHNELSDNDRELLKEIIDSVYNEHLVLSENHNESKAIAYELAYYFGLDGLEYYLTIRKQRSGYNEAKSTANYFQLCQWVKNSGYTRNGNIQTIKHFYYRALNKKREEESEMFNVGTFKRIN